MQEIAAYFHLFVYYTFYFLYSIASNFQSYFSKGILMDWIRKPWNGILNSNSIGFRKWNHTSVASRRRASMPASTQTTFNCAPLKSSVDRANSSKLTSGWTFIFREWIYNNKYKIQSTWNKTIIYLKKIEIFYLQDSGPCFLSGMRKLDLTIQPSRSHQGRIQNISPICCCYHLHTTPCYHLPSVVVGRHNNKNHEMLWR